MQLTTKNLTVRYGGVQAVTGVFIALEEKSIVTLIGANGAGKSTILKALSGLLTPAAGEIWFHGDRVDGLPPYEIVKRGMVQVPEGRRLFPYMAVMGNLRMGAYLRRDEGEIQKDLEKVFARFPILKERKKQMAGTLSGGEQQMLAIGRALLAKPVTLMMDEPSLGLAPRMVQEIARITRDINREEKVSIILVEQNSKMALNVADKGYVLEVGKITLEGKPQDLLNNEYVKKAYLG